MIEIDNGNIVEVAGVNDDEMWTLTPGDDQPFLTGACGMGFEPCFTDGIGQVFQTGLIAIDNQNSLAHFGSAHLNTST